MTFFIAFVVLSPTHLKKTQNCDKAKPPSKNRVNMKEIGYLRRDKDFISNGIRTENEFERLTAWLTIQSLF